MSEIDILARIERALNQSKQQPIAAPLPEAVAALNARLAAKVVLTPRQRGIVEQWCKTVNMTAAQLRAFMESDECRNKSLIADILRLKTTSFDQWTESMWSAASKHARFVENLRRVNPNNPRERRRVDVALKTRGHERV